MKALKHFALAALAVAGLLLPLASTRPQPASAEGCSGLAAIISLGQCQGFGTSYCQLNNIGVTATTDVHQYTYDLLCSATATLHVSAAYTTATNLAHESITFGDDGSKLEAAWSCSNDPWPELTPLTCFPTKSSATGGSAASVVTHPGDWPFSINGVLDDDGHHTLAAQLQYTINHSPAPAPAPAPLHIVESSTVKATDCVICNLLGTAPAPAPAPTLPDLKVPTLGGDTSLALGLPSVYSIGVSNLGAKPLTQVQVEIQVTGAVEYVGMTQTPAGWDCSGAGPIICVGPIGGAGDPVQSLAVSFGMQVRGTKAGIGAISATVDPNNLIHESDETNNAKTLAITVK